MSHGVSIAKLEAFAQDALGVSLDEVGEIHIAHGVVTLITAPSRITGGQDAVRFPLVPESNNSANVQRPELDEGPKPGPGPRTVA